MPCMLLRYSSVLADGALNDAGTWPINGSTWGKTKGNTVTIVLSQCLFTGRSEARKGASVVWLHHEWHMVRVSHPPLSLCVWVCWNLLEHTRPVLLPQRPKDTLGAAKKVQLRQRAQSRMVPTGLPPSLAQSRRAPRQHQLRTSTNASWGPVPGLTRARSNAGTGSSRCSWTTCTWGENGHPARV